MKRTAMPVISFITAACVAVSCGVNIDTAKKDIDFLFNTIEHVWLVTVEYTRKGRADEGLDLCERYVRERQDEIRAAGKRMSDFMFNNEVRLHYAERFQKYREATDKYENYLTSRLSVSQMKRFSDITAGMIGEPYMKSIEWTTDPWEFHKKAFKSNL